MRITTPRLGTIAVAGAALGLATVVAIGTTAVVGADGGAQHGHATIVDATGAEIGWAKFVEDGDGTVHVNVKVAGLSEGLHGAHIHENGACSPFSAAGSHYRADGTTHPEHYGDLPNLEVNRAGHGHLEATTDRVSLSPGGSSLFDATGSAIIIHADPDAFTSTNFGGGRIACGVIVAD